MSSGNFSTSGYCTEGISRSVELTVVIPMNIEMQHFFFKKKVREQLNIIHHE